MLSYKKTLTLIVVCLSLLCSCRSNQKPAINISPVNDTTIKTPINNTKGTITISSSTITGSSNTTKIAENALIKVINEHKPVKEYKHIVKTEITQKTTTGALITTITTTTTIKPARNYGYILMFIALGLSIFLYLKRKGVIKWKI